MKNLTERLNLSLSDNLNNSMELKSNGYGAYYYDNLCLYCAENDIDLIKVTDLDFSNCAECIEMFANATCEENHTHFYLSIDKE